VVGLLDWELWAQASHVAFACHTLVAMDGEDVTRRGRELHGQMGVETTAPRVLSEGRPRRTL